MNTLIIWVRSLLGAVGFFFLSVSLISEYPDSIGR